MALRDPRNKSRNNASKRTTSATRSKRAASSAKYNPKPSSAAQRSGKKGSGSSKVTTGKGGKASSPRLKQALDSVKTKRTPAKTPSKATAAGNARVVAEAFKKTLKQRLALDKLEKAKKGTKGTGVRTARGSKPVQTTPDSNPAKRGAQGPRTATPSSTSTRRTLAASGNTGRTGATDAQGRARNQPASKVRSSIPPTAKPKASNIGPQIRQAKRVQAANPGRAARAARHANTARVVATATNPLTIAGAIIGSDIKNRSVADGTLKGKPNVPTKPGNHKATTTTKPRPKKPVDKNPIKAPPKKGSTVLAKKNGKEGVLRNGVFYATGWSPTQRNRYQIEKKKNQK